MGLMSTLHNAISGLNVSQAQMGIISRNVANQSTVGYTRRTLSTQETSATGITAGAVRETSVNRVLDNLLQKQLRTESAGAAYTATRADYLNRVDTLFGTPGSDTGLNAAFAKFSTSLQQMAQDPASSTTRQNVLATAGSLAANISSLSKNVQTMRGEIESKIADQVSTVNNLLQGIETTTSQLARTQDSATRAGLLDERDKYIDQLSSYFDTKTFDGGNGNFSIYTTSGAPLFVEGRGLRLQFDERFAVSANAQYNTNPTLSGLGGLRISDPIGGSVDMMQGGLIQSGSFAALFDLRDKVLVDTQTQLDDFAAALTTTLGDKTITGAAATVGAQTGFDLDINALQSGNIISMEYTALPGGTKQKVSFIAVNNPGVLPLAAGATPDPNDIEYGIDFSGGLPAAMTAIGTALGASFTVSNQGGGVVRILDDGATTTKMNSLSARATVTSLTNNGLAIPLFVDGSNGSKIYTGSFDAGSQKVGYASGIQVNPAILADPSRLVVYQTAPTTTLNGDPARPSYLRDQLQAYESDFTPAVALTGSTAVYHGTTSQFLDRLIANQTQAASNAQTLSEGQQTVVNTLAERAAKVSGVNSDEELSNLIEIQNIYSANARIVSVVKDLFDTLMRI